MRALLVLQGKTTWDDSFIANDSRTRTLPNRTFVVTSFSPTRGWRPEGVCQMEIWHNFQATAQPDQSITEPSVDLDAYLGATFDTLNLGGALNATNMGPLADAITAAGRWLAIPDPTDQTGTAAKIAADNADMVNFRCDWVKMSTPSLTRGTDKATTNWSEIVHLSAFISHASIPIPPLPLQSINGLIGPTLDAQGNILSWGFFDAGLNKVIQVGFEDGLLVRLE